MSKQDLQTSLLVFAGVALASTVSARLARRNHVLLCSKSDLAKDLAGQTYIVTGSNSGVGLETTRQLVKQGAHVIMACRRPAAADKEAKAFASFKGTYEAMACDLSDLASVRAFCQAFLKNYKQLNGLVCNAGMVNMDAPKKTTKDGFETTLGVSYFGHFLMTELLLDVLKKSAPNARMIILSSVVSAGDPKNRPDVDLSDLNYETRPYHNMNCYREAKVACCLYALELADRLKGTGVSTVSVHPGWARSNFAGGATKWYNKFLLSALEPLYYHMTDSSEESAQTTLHCLLNDDALPKHSGAFFSQHSYLYVGADGNAYKGGWPLENPNPHTRDLAKAKELVKVTRKMVGLDDK